MNQFVLEGKNLQKSYTDGRKHVDVLSDLNIQIEKGELIAIVGASGSGKSTLLNLLGGLDKPSSGEVFVMGQAFSELSDDKRGHVRNKHLGFVYQFHHLLPEFSAFENVKLPMQIGGFNDRDANDRAASLLERVGLESRIDHRPAALSGGERQRVAIARALATQPSCVLLDEPTGNLDKKNAQNIHALIAELARDNATSFVVVTHDEHLAGTLDRVLTLEDGILVDTK